jgi:hypothetical protein
MLKEEHRLRVFDYKVLRKMGGGSQEAGEDCLMGSFLIYSIHPT